MKLPWIGHVHWRTVIPTAVREYLRDDMVTYAAALAFHFLFALFPFTLFFITLLGTLQISWFFDWALEHAAVALPADAFSVVSGVVEELRNSSSGGLLSLGIGVAVWSASAGVRALMNALNSAYDVPEARAMWKRYLYSLLYTVGFAVLMIASGLLLAVGPDAFESLAGYVGLDEVVVTLWTVLRWPVAVFLLMLVASAVYYLLPNVKQPFRFITPGAVLAVLTWIVASLGFGFYASRFGNYGSTYGSVGGIIVLMLYFFISANVLLAGAELNAQVYEFKRGKATPDDTSEIGQLSPELRGARRP